MHRQLLQDATADHDDLDDQNHPPSPELVGWVRTDASSYHGEYILQSFRMAPTQRYPGQRKGVGDADLQPQSARYCGLITYSPSGWRSPKVRMKPGRATMLPDICTW